MNQALMKAATKYQEIQKLKEETFNLDRLRWSLEREVSDLCFRAQLEMPELIDWLEEPANFSYTEERFGNMLIYIYQTMKSEEAEK